MGRESTEEEGRGIIMSTSELACTYAALILHDDGVQFTEDKIKSLIAAAGVEVEAYWPGLFAKLLEKANIEDLIMNVGSGPAPAAAGGAAPAAAAGEAAKAPEPEEEEEEEEDMEFDLFD